MCASALQEASPAWCPPECRCQRVTPPQPSKDPGAKTVLGTDRGVGWPPSQEPRQWEPPQLQTPGGDVLLPAWVAGLLRGSESPSCTPPGPWRSPPAGPGAPPGQDVAVLPSLGREGRRARGAGGLQVVHREAEGCRLLRPPSGTALVLLPQLHPQPAAPLATCQPGHPPSQRHSLSPCLTLSLGVKGARAPSAAFSPLLPEPVAGSTATRGPSGHVSGLGSAQAHPWGRQLGSQALALSP